MNNPSASRRTEYHFNTMRPNDWHLIFQRMVLSRLWNDYHIHKYVAQANRSRVTYLCEDTNGAIHALYHRNSEAALLGLSPAFVRRLSASCCNALYWDRVIAVRHSYRLHR
jgi:hypothetical protein